MAGKPNIRSIRFLDELVELIDRQAEDTFAEKFEGLITRCVWKLPQKEELKRLEKDIRQERKRLAELRKRRTKLGRMMQGSQIIWKIAKLFPGGLCPPCVRNTLHLTMKSKPGPLSAICGPTARFRPMAASGGLTAARSGVNAGTLEKNFDSFQVV